MLYRYRAGTPWRDLPERFGDPIKVHIRFSRWAKGGVWKRMFELLAADADNEHAMIDSTIVRAHQHSAGAQKIDGEDQAIGRSKGGLSTKIHTLVDALGNPLGFFLTQAKPMICRAAMRCYHMQADTLLADKVFDADERVIILLAAGKTVVIPPKSSRKAPRPFDRELYKARHLIENFYCNAQAIPRHRYPLRQDRLELPRCNPPRRCYSI